MTDTPTPGSDEAVTRGCLCPRIDNGYGRGAGEAFPGDVVFWVNEGCPLHDLEREDLGDDRRRTE